MLDPKLARAFYYLCAVDIRSRSYADSDRELKHALELEPTLFEARITLINLFIDQKLWQPALDNVDTFLLEFPNSPYRAEIAVTRSRVVAHLETR